MTRQGRAALYALAAVLLWSTVASAFKLSLRHLDPPQLLLYASAVSALVLVGILAAQGRLGVLLTYTRAQYLRSALLGFLNPFLSLVFIRTLVGEEILPSTFAGLALIVAGLAVQQALTSPPSAPRSGPPCA